MKDNIACFFRAVPTPLAGLALAIASLGWCWESATNFHGQALSACLASLLLMLILLKFLFNPSLLKQDLSHYISGSVLPTFTMASMIIANSIEHSSPLCSVLLWLSAIIIHLVFLLFFTYYRLKAFRFEHLVPSWFIPPVGIVVATVSFPHNALASELHAIAYALLLFGLFAYVLLLPTMLYRYFMRDPLARHEQPTLAIFAAPASLTLAGYLTISEQPNDLLVALLAVTALIMTLFVYGCFIKLLRLPFTPGYSAFTFPLVIGATAMFKTQQYAVVNGGPLWLSEWLQSIAYGELIIATLMVGYVSLRYLDCFNPFRKSLS